MLAFSKNIFIDKAKKINLTKPNVLDKLLSKFELKAKFIKKEIHRRNKAKKNLFLKIVKSFFWKYNEIKIKEARIVFKLINRLPIKKHKGNIEIMMPKSIELYI